MTVAQDNTFDYIDSSSYWIEKDEKVMLAINTMPVQDNVIYQYNQHLTKDIDTNYMCTVFASAIAASSLFNKQMTRKELEAACMVGVNKYKMRLSGGNATQVGAKAMGVYINQNREKKAGFFLATMFDEYFEKCLDKWLLAVVTLRGYPSWNALFFAQMLNGVIKGWKDMRSKTGHAICIGRWKDGWYRFYNSDSKLSKAECSKAVLQDMLKQGAFYAPVRIRLPLDKITTLTPEQYKAANAIIEAAGLVRNAFPETRPTMEALANAFRSKTWQQK